MTKLLTLKAKALTQEAFEPFGDVIQEEGANSYKINRGSTLRIHDLCAVKTKSRGRVLVNFFQALDTVSLPYTPAIMECHPLGSQAFIPRSKARFLILVAPPADEPEPHLMQAFVTDGLQGVNYDPGVWHLPLASFELATYVVVDRGGPGENLREFELAEDHIVITRYRSRDFRLGHSLGRDI
jgi:ureidoglycolate lyase